MANVKLKIRVADGTGDGGTNWSQLFPETTLDQITDATDAGRALLSAAAATGDNYFKITESGGSYTVSYKTPAQVLSDIGASPLVHTHKISNVSVAETVDNGYLGKTLVEALNDKADLIDGLIDVNQIPSTILGGMQFVDTISGSVTLGTSPITIAGTGEEYYGQYWIASSTTTVSSSGDYAITTPGDEGDNSSSVTLEPGDWIVYLDYNDTLSTKYAFAVINNTYANASTGNVGVVRLSSTSATTRGGLNGTSSYLRAVDEKVLRNVTKDIWYESSEAAAANALVGDILFHIE